MRDSGKPKYLDGKRDLTSTQEAGFWKTNLGAGWGIFFACQSQEFRKSLFFHLSFFRFFPSASSYWGGKALIQTDIQNINRKQEPITRSLHLPYKPLESTLSDEELFLANQRLTLLLASAAIGLFSAGSKPWDKEGPGLPKKCFGPSGLSLVPK